jgi:zinc D-Ala-D-Ala carboxypeptidase
MKPNLPPIKSKRQPNQPNPRSGGFFQTRLGLVAIALMVAGLVLIVGGKLEPLFIARPLPNAAPNVAPPVKPRMNPVTATQSASPSAPQAAPTPLSSGLPKRIANPNAQPNTKPNTSPNDNPNISPNAESSMAMQSAPNYFGHLPYGEVSPDRLVSIGKFLRENYEREEMLDIEAARAFQVMLDAARSQGVQLMGISGFRTIADQQVLFEKQIEKRGSAAVAAQLSAPPGHSEHHTGYAIDITDASRIDVDLKVAFEETAAYQWLVTNASQYGFEQSFPRNNVQAVSYEPWHWRFVGTARSAQVFAAARISAQSR